MTPLLILAAAVGTTRPALAPLAPALGDRTITRPRDWPAVAVAPLLGELASATPAQRQQVRWRYALAQLSAGRPAEALGALDVMAADEPDLALAAAFQLARGRALVDLGRGGDAVAPLTNPALIANAEACAWRLRAYEQAGAVALAAHEVACAKPALAARPIPARAPFLLAAARAALKLGRPDDAGNILRFVAAHDPEAQLLRARVLLAKGQPGPATSLFASLQHSSDRSLAAAAELGSVEAGLARHRLSPSTALQRLTLLRFRWRGDEVEREALLLSFDLARTTRNPGAALSAAAILVRYRSAGGGLAAVLTQAQAILAQLLDPAGGYPLSQAAGLYWDYRDLAPGGADGDALVWRLADRLQDAQLYPRAAELLEHVMTERAHDVAQGPLSIRIARLRILAGQPDKALEALRLSSETIYPADMLHDRQRMEAIALFQLGRAGEALAVLQSVPGAGALQAELLWKQHSWAAYTAAATPHLPPPHGLSEVQQALVLRQAISLGMLGREAPLAALRVRYANAFATLPTARAFDQLTRPSGTVDPASLDAALAAMPSISPAGDLADLIELAPMKRAGG